jgi:hypothetical protein
LVRTTAYASSSRRSKFEQTSLYLKHLLLEHDAFRQ